jgi:plastocyanin
MKKIFLSVLTIVLAALSASAGNITGTVRAEGKKVPGDAGSGGKYESRKYKFVEKVNYDQFTDFVVYIEGPVGGKPIVPEKPLSVNTERVAQEGAKFSPHILPVVVGTTVEWPNNDEIYHNVFSMSDAKPFDLDLYKGDPPNKKVTFDKAGRVDVFCSIHANMHCIVLVLENPYFAKTDSRGRYSIENVPPGTYKLTAWHERMPKQTQEIVVPKIGDVKMDFVLGINNLPKY